MCQQVCFHCGWPACITQTWTDACSMACIIIIIIIILHAHTEDFSSCRTPLTCRQVGLVKDGVCGLCALQKRCNANALSKTRVTPPADTGAYRRHDSCTASQTRPWPVHIACHMNHVACHMHHIRAPRSRPRCTLTRSTLAFCGLLKQDPQRVCRPGDRSYPSMPSNVLKQPLNP